MIIHRSTTLQNKLQEKKKQTLPRVIKAARLPGTFGYRCFCKKKKKIRIKRKQKFEGNDCPQASFNQKA